VTIHIVIYQEHSNVHTETFRKEESTMKVELTFPEEFAEQEAKAKKVGLWQDKNPMPPWEFRHPPRQ
jgi:hypothetical protein